MACEACSAKFSLFKRKKRCTDCLRYFCSECVIKKVDKMFSCDNCSMLSRRPLIRSQVTQMRSRDLRQYLLAKNVSIQGCVEKEDLVSLIMLLANGSDDRSNNQSADDNTGIRQENVIEGLRPWTPVSSPPSPQPPAMSAAQVQEPEEHPPEQPVDFTSNSVSSVLENNTDENNVERHQEARAESSHFNNVEIEEISGSDYSVNGGPEPLITEQDDISNTLNVQHTEVLTEIPMWSDIVKLSDINELSELEYLSVKQLKNLLSTNRVDFKGCVERSELLDRASRLWEEYKQARADVEKLDEENLCKICWDAPIECVILECGHMACCINCGKQMSECPICKQYVVRVVRFFKA